MKKLLLSIFTFLSFTANTYAEEIFIPNGRVRYYVGGFASVEQDLKAKIFEKGIEKCGTLENLIISRSQITLSLGNIYTHPVLGSEETIQGSYPQVSAVVNITCYE